MNISGYSTKTITLESAQAAVAAGVAAAAAMGVPMSVVVVDAAGQPKAAARMDGASILSHEVAWRKAWTAAVTGAPTAGVHHFVASDAGSLISMPQIPGFTVIAGGLPLQADGSTLGAIGVSGATAELDLQVATAALAALG